MKYFVHMITPQETFIFKLNKKDMKLGKFLFEGKEYIIDKKYMHYYEKRKLFLKKRAFYLYYYYDQPLPLAITPELKKEQLNDFNAIIHSHILSELFRPPVMNLLIIVLMLVLGLAAGVVFGIILYPHIIPMPQPTNTTTTQPLR